MLVPHRGKVSLTAAVLAVTALAAPARAGDVAHEIDLRLNAGALPQWTAPEGRTATLWAALQQFYAARGHAPAWLDGDTLRPQARALARALEATPAEGGDVRRYVVAAPALAGDGAGDWPTALAERDLRLSYAFLRLAHDQLEGRASPRGASAYWAAPSAPELDGPALLRAATGDGGPEPVLESLRPTHPQYAALVAARAWLRGVEAAGGWPQVPALPPLKRGSRHVQLALLRARLAAGGDLPAAAAPPRPDVFDRELEMALKRFQSRHGLPALGRLDGATLAALNVPVTARVRQVELNLERWRWLPRVLGERYVLVNVPAFELFAVDHGRTAERMKVVSGRAGETPTPIFTASMTTVIFSPWWNVPPRIAAEEIAPAVLRNASYLSRRGLRRVTDGGGTQFRQPPGPGNPMGDVKFLLPNPFNVYLHDTPEDGAFAATRRDLSHGCMRVERPLALARWVLTDPGAWTDARLRAAMRARVERHVPLAGSIPVYVTYFTAWVEADGRLRFLPDVYGHDAPQEPLLDGQGPWQRLADLRSSD
jgi:L,D-transpeptidase YcbB